MTAFGEPDDDEVVCRECHEPFGQITASHLSLHGMTMDEYRDEHPDAPLAPETVRDATGWTDSHDDETRRRIAESIKTKHAEGDYAGS